MPAHYELKTVLRADSRLVLLDVLSGEEQIAYERRDGGELDKRRRYVRVRCRACGTRKTMLRQTALQAITCGCALNAPVPCPRCGELVIKRGLAGHISFAHRSALAPAWWAEARAMRAAGKSVAAIARAVGRTWEGVSYALKAAA